MAAYICDSALMMVGLEDYCEVEAIFKKESGLGKWLLQRTIFGVLTISGSSQQPGHMI